MVYTSIVAMQRQHLVGVFTPQTTPSLQQGWIVPVTTLCTKTVGIR